MKKLSFVWWLLFIGAALPSSIFMGLYFFNPRALGVDPVEVLLQESGEWSLRLLLVTLACSPIRRLGWKGAVKYRRMLGLYTFYYATLHLLTYLILWIEIDWALFLEDISKRSFIYIGLMTWTVLLVLAITSPKWAVRKLKKRWVLVHKSVYFAVIAAWIHLWMQSRASAGEAVLYGAFVLLLLGERVYRHIRRRSLAISST